MIEYLKWDSDFFGFKTGLLIQNNDIEFEKQIEEAKDDDYKLIYFFANDNSFIPETIIQKFNGKLVDRKVIYEQYVSEGTVRDLGLTTIYDQQVVSNDLLQLAYESGQYSRFKLDDGFEPDVFIRMYKLWIENSVKGSLADKVYVVNEAEHVVGMVTLKTKKDTMTIGLIAISPAYAGKGLGRQLINRTIQTALDLGLKRIEVSTQYDNKSACLFYKACGFSTKLITDIYHFWMQPT